MGVEVGEVVEDVEDGSGVGAVGDRDLSSEPSFGVPVAHSRPGCTTSTRVNHSPGGSSTSRPSSSISHHCSSGNSGDSTFSPPTRTVWSGSR